MMPNMAVEGVGRTITTIAQIILTMAIEAKDANTEAVKLDMAEMTGQDTKMITEIDAIMAVEKAIMAEMKSRDITQIKILDMVEEDIIAGEVATTMVKTMVVAKEAKETTMILKAEGAFRVLCSMHRSTQNRQKIHPYSAALSHIFLTTIQRYRRILTWTSHNLSTRTKPS